MAKITRVLQKIFGENALPTEVAKFGSLAAGSPTNTQDPLLIQSLSNFTDGWYAAVLGGNSPAIEDMNALCFLYARQLAYIFQAGIAEYDSTTAYYKGSLAQDDGVIYKSLTDNNLGNALTSSANWAPIDGSVKQKTANYTVDKYDDMIVCDASAGAFTLTLPSASANLGKKFHIVKKDTSSNGVTIASSDMINGEASQIITEPYSSIIVKSTGSEYVVF